MNKAPKSKKQGNVGSIIACACGFLLFTVLLIFLLAENGSYLFGAEPEDFYDMVEDGDEPEEGEFVRIDVDAVVDWYAETEYRINGIIPAGKEQHCFLWLDNDAFVSMTVKGKENIEKVDKLIEETQAVLNYESEQLPAKVTFVGRITSIDSEVSKYYSDAMDAWGIYESDGLTIYDVTIDTTDTKLSIWIFIGIAFVLDLVMVFTIISCIKKMKQAKAVENYAFAYEPDNSYNQNNAYAPNDAYNQNNGYAPNDAYNQDNPYGQNAPYNQGGTDDGNNTPYQQ